MKGVISMFSNYASNNFKQTLILTLIPNNKVVFTHSSPGRLYKITLLIILHMVTG